MLSELKAKLAELEFQCGEISHHLKMVKALSDEIRETIEAAEAEIELEEASNDA